MSIIKVFLILFLFSFSSTQSFAADTLKNFKLALNWKPEPQFGGFYNAQLNGHFKKEGLSAEILEGGAGTPVVQMVAAKQIDFGIVSADEVVISRSNGSDVVAIFAAYQTNPQGIMVREESGVKDLKDLFSKSEMTLALQKGLPYAMYLQKKFAPTKVKLVPYSGGISNFLNDPKFAQQCFVTSEPIAARRQGKSPKTFLVAEAGYNPYTTVLITRGEVLKSNPALVASVVKAVRAGWQEYVSTPDSTNIAMAKMNKAMDLQTFKESAEAQKPLIVTKETEKLGVGSMTDARWKELIEQLFELKIIKKKPEVSSVYKSL